MMCWNDDEKKLISEYSLGENWSCSFPDSSTAVLKCGDKKPIYVKKKETDVFVLSGSQELINKIYSKRLFQKNSAEELVIRLQLVNLLEELQESVCSFVDVQSGNKKNSAHELDEYWNEIEKLEETERKSWSSRRIGQDRLRNFLLKTCNGCIITGITREELLIASHIKPWKDCCFNKSECLDPENILLLAKNYDAFFDAALISFSPVDGSLIVSNLVSSEELSMMGIDRSAKLSDLSTRRSEYLKWHNKILKDKEKQ